MKRRRLAVEKQVTLTESTMTIDQLQRSAKQKGSTPLNSDQAGKLLELASREVVIVIVTVVLVSVNVDRHCCHSFQWEAQVSQQLR